MIRPRLPALSLLLALAACAGDKATNEGATGVGDTPLEGFLDEDNDSFPADEDCNDTEGSVHPGAVELCDGLDNDCDGEIDEDVDNTWYEDADGDGYGDPGTATASCEAPAGAVATGTDCDDGDAAINPAAADPCDDVDNDCDGLVDDGLRDTFYVDADGDGFGDPAAPVEACGPEEGLVTDNTDCDDEEAATFPGNPEVCDEVDNDCDGLVDEGLGGTWYVDDDGDGWGQDASAVETCDPPTGAVERGGDCDDADAATNPDALEICDGSDDDCDGLIDDYDDSVDLSTGETFYPDRDSDLFGDPDAPTRACWAPPGFVSTPPTATTAPRR